MSPKDAMLRECGPESCPLKEMWCAFRSLSIKPNRFCSSRLECCFKLFRRDRQSGEVMSSSTGPLVKVNERRSTLVVSFF